MSEIVVFNHKWHQIEERTWAMSVPGGILLKLREDVTTVTFVAGLGVRINSFENRLSDLIVTPSVSEVTSLDNSHYQYAPSLLCICGRPMWHHKVTPHCDGFILALSHEALKECRACKHTLAQHDNTSSRPCCVSSCVCEGFHG